MVGQEVCVDICKHWNFFCGFIFYDWLRNCYKNKGLVIIKHYKCLCGKGNERKQLQAASCLVFSVAVYGVRSIWNLTTVYQCLCKTNIWISDDRNNFGVICLFYKSIFDWELYDVIEGRCFFAKFLYQPGMGDGILHPSVYIPIYNRFHIDKYKRYII